MSIKHIFSVLFNRKKMKIHAMMPDLIQAALNIFKNVRQCGKRK